mmetsp:Transcript_120500/g.337345  ORF Transcript_120500/g.337345 Transcript_120500/m.337345 type:complete len:233 (-) Transcript_120500:9-707(-)
MPAPPAPAARGRLGRSVGHRSGGEHHNLDDKVKLQKGILDTFKEWDLNGDGTISLPELKSVLTSIGVDETHIPKLFSLADANKDGVVVVEEFVSWLGMVAPTAAAQARGIDAAARAAAPPRRAAERGGHPLMSPMPLSRDERKVLVTCKLAAPVCPHLDFSIKIAPSTRIAEIARIICENHGGSIHNPMICVGRFHPQDERPYSSTLEDCGVIDGEVSVYYDYVAQAGAVLA